MFVSMMAAVDGMLHNPGLPGTTEENLLLPKFNVATLVKSPKEVGIAPCRLLDWTLKLTIITRLLTKFSGNVPENLFEYSRRYEIFVKSQI